MWFAILALFVSQPTCAIPTDPPSAQECQKELGPVLTLEQQYAVLKAAARSVAARTGQYAHFDGFGSVINVDGFLHSVLRFSRAGHHIDAIAILDPVLNKIVNVVVLD